MIDALIDTHCHLALLEERGLLEQAIENARAQGISHIVSVGLNVEDSDRNRVIAERYSGVSFTVGWHPHEPTAPDKEQLAALDELLRHPKAVAVGEIGLDMYWRPGYHETPAAIQQRAISMMFELAAHHNKPVIIHDRDAHDAIVETLEAWSQVKGVMHCFSGDVALAKRCIDIGYFISFSGIVTFPKSEMLQAVARGVASESYVVETDSPYLAPVPHRGQPNEPAFVRATCDAVAALRGLDPAVAARETRENAQRLFGINPSDTLITHRG